MAVQLSRAFGGQTRRSGVPRGTENFRGREETSVEVRTVRMNDEQSSDIVGMVLFVLFSLTSFS